MVTQSYHTCCLTLRMAIKKSCIPSCTTCLALHIRERFPQTFGSHYSSLGQCGQSHLNSPLCAVACRFKRLIKMRISGPTSEFDSLLSKKVKAKHHSQRNAGPHFYSHSRLPYLPLCRLRGKVKLRRSSVETSRRLSYRIG